jgi:membrane protease YdiL (CAAX protease family)
MSQALSWQAAFTLLVIAPCLEETVFRAGLHEALLRRAVASPALAHLANGAVALLFGVAHAALQHSVWALAVALPAAAIGLLYQHTRSLPACIAAHAAMNAVWLLIWAARA